MSKSHKRRLQRLRQAHRKKVSKLGGITIKELPSHDISCLVAINEKMANGKADVKMKSVVEAQSKVFNNKTSYESKTHDEQAK